MTAQSYFRDALHALGNREHAVAEDLLRRLLRLPREEQGAFPPLAAQLLKICRRLEVQRLMREGLMRVADAVLESALTESPENPDLLLLRVLQNNNAMKFPAALRLLESIPPGAHPAYPLFLATIRLNMGDLPGAEKALDQEIHPGLQPFAAWLKAVARLRVHAYSEAEPFLLESLGGRPSFRDARLDHLALLLVSRRYQEAEELATDMAQEGTEDLTVPAYHLAARARLNGLPNPQLEEIAQQEQPSDPDVIRWADSRFFQMLPMEPDILNITSPPETWFRMVLGEIKKRLLESCPDVAELHFAAGRVRQRHKDIDGALAGFRKCLELDPNFFPARISEAYALEQAGKIDDALQAFENLCRDLEREPGILLKGGIKLLNETRYSGQEDLLEVEGIVLETLVDHSRDLADINYELGRLCILRERPQEALPYLDHALEMNPSFALAGVAKAVVLMQLGRYDSARRILDALEKDDILLDRIRFRLASLLLGRNRNGEAQNLLRTVAEGSSDCAEAARSLLAGP